MEVFETDQYIYDWKRGGCLIAIHPSLVSGGVMTEARRVSVLNNFSEDPVSFDSLPSSEDVILWSPVGGSAARLGKDEQEVVLSKRNSVLFVPKGTSRKITAGPGALVVMIHSGLEFSGEYPSENDVSFASHIVSECSEGNFDSVPRVYVVINDVPVRIARGGHRHDIMHPDGGAGKQEAVFSARGVIHFESHAPKNSETTCQTVDLSEPRETHYIPHNVHHSASMEPGSVLVSLASTPFRPNEWYKDAFACKCGKHQ